MNLSSIAKRDIYGAALGYAERGLSIIPVQGKKAIGQWQQYQQAAADEDKIVEWAMCGAFDSGLAVVCGQVSGVVVIDLDGFEAIQLYHHYFGHLEHTFTVHTGSGKGKHLYYIPTEGQWNTTKITGVELRGNGAYVVAPPSRHPSGRLYKVANDLPVMEADLSEVRVWIAKQQALKRDQPAPLQHVARVSTGAATHSSDWSALRIKAYVDGAKARECNHVSRAPQGERNNSIYHAARRLASLAACPDVARLNLLNEAEIFRLLEAAGAEYASTDGYAALCRTINSGIRTGVAQPAHLPRG